ncbi:MAG: hypothetical protein IPQ01_07990 [Zoogloea sp.]|nr:hypothetical protein [Zoogloea sp.]
MELDSSGLDAMIDLADIAPAFSFVVSKGLVLVPIANVQAQDSALRLLVGEGAPFSLRFRVRVGERVFVDGRSMPLAVENSNRSWFVDNSITQQQLGEPPDLTDMADLLQVRWDKVTSLFSDPQKTSQLQAFAKQKSAALLSKIFRKP